LLIIPELLEDNDHMPKVSHSSRLSNR
jgi:hypothetical protein